MRAEASIGRCEEALRGCGCDNNIIPPTLAHKTLLLMLPRRDALRASRRRSARASKPRFR
jgi:hypothetical protein